VPRNCIIPFAGCGDVAGFSHFSKCRTTRACTLLHDESGAIVRDAGRVLEAELIIMLYTYGLPPASDMNLESTEREVDQASLYEHHGGMAGAHTDHHRSPIGACQRTKSNVKAEAAESDEKATAFRPSISGRLTGVYFSRLHWSHTHKRQGHSSAIQESGDPSTGRIVTIFLDCLIITAGGCTFTPPPEPQLACSDSTSCAQEMYSGIRGVSTMLPPGRTRHWSDLKLMLGVGGPSIKSVSQHRRRCVWQYLFPSETFAGVVAFDV
jgi:hypothetical protein